LSYSLILTRIFLYVFPIFFFIACDVSEPEKALTARTNKTSYTSSELVLVTLNNNLDKDIYFQKCGSNLYRFYEKLDSIPSSGWVAVFVCRPLIAFELKSGSKFTDTLAFLPGSYRLKYYYDFDDLNPEIFQQELLTNTFSIK
jgi:hypothetical protein